jgi:hypothetical protein
MQTKPREVNIRFVSSNLSLASTSGHQVRTLTERTICDWLTDHEISHQHASDVYIVKAAASGSPALFVPDIVLRRKTDDGRTIIIEAMHSFSPKRGGLKTLLAFRKQYREQFLIILIGKKSLIESIPKNIVDLRIELEILDTLEKKLDRLMG